MTKVRDYLDKAELTKVFLAIFASHVEAFGCERQVALDQPVLVDCGNLASITHVQCQFLEARWCELTL